MIIKEKHFVPVKKFFQETTQPLSKNRFIVKFTDSASFSSEKEKLNTVIGNMPVIREDAVTNIQFPNGFNVTKENSHSYIFPTVELKELGSYELTVTFLEDDRGTVLAFENWLRRKIIDPDGLHRPQSINRIDLLEIFVFDHNDNVVALFIFKNLFLLSTEIIGLDYSGGDPVERTITLASSNFEYYPIKHAQSVEMSDDRYNDRVTQ